MLNSSPYRNPDIVQIRRATPADIPQIRDLERRAPTAAHWSAVQYDALFAHDAASRVVLVAEDSIDITINGFLVARCLPDEWEIENLVVDINSRQRGIGASLVRVLVERARVAGVHSIVLEVRASNRPAVRLYETIGFIQEGRRGNYYQAPSEDALLYRLTLQSYDKIS